MAFDIKTIIEKRNNANAYTDTEYQLPSPHMEGNPVTIRPLPPTVITSIRAKHTHFDNVTKKDNIDMAKVNLDMVIEALVDPRLKNAELQDSVGAKNAYEALDAIFTADDYAYLIGAVNALTYEGTLDDFLSANESTNN